MRSIKNRLLLKGRKNKQTIITILLAIVAMAGQAQTPKDSCSIPKDSLCQERIAKSDTINCPLDKLFLLKANVTNKEESKRNLPKIALPKNDIYREKFMNLQLINIIGSHLSRWKNCAEHSHSRGDMHLGYSSRHTQAVKELFDGVMVSPFIDIDFENERDQQQAMENMNNMSISGAPAKS